MLEHEKNHVHNGAWSAGCGFLDFAHLVADFNNIPFENVEPPKQEDGRNKDERETLSCLGEAGTQQRTVEMYF